MKFFTNKGVIQKTILAMVIVMVTTFCVPTVVHADIGGKLMSPIINFIAAIFDGVQHMLERTMIGETASFMKTIGTDTYETSASSGVSITTDEFIDVTFWGINKVNVPVIRYTPEAIFSNQVPALDVNFIKPSVQGDDDRNVAKQLRPIIASWYVALRSIAIVGLLSVLVYLGIRMLLTSIAADRAKYKQMLVDWIVAMCLVFVLHYIMSFALTMVESVTAMLASEADGTFTVHATNVDGISYKTYRVDFAANLMSYVRFMVQAGDLQVKIAFLALYIMLVIFSIRFTWVYGKRVVNMAFLTLIAPMVALTYPIDKVSDGKAQAFNMWLKEFTYNALIQPIHLLLYKVLLGTAIDLAVDNVLYAIIALGFIIAAEKLVKQMFGFNKASGGTVGSLAGAAGVTAVAGNMLKGVAKNGPGPGGKVRTKDTPERQGKDADANKGFEAFKDKSENEMVGAGTDTSLSSPDGNASAENSSLNAPLPEGDTPPPENDNSLGDLEKQLDGYNETDQYFLDPEHQRLQEEYQTQREQANQQNEEEVPLPEEGDPLALDSNSDTQPNFWNTVKQDTGNFFKRGGQRLDAAKDAWNNFKTPEGKRAFANRLKDGLNRKAIGAWKALPTVTYKAARGTLKVASGAALAAVMGGVGTAIGSTIGDGEKAASTGVAAATVGAGAGGKVFEATVGKRMKDRSIRDVHGAAIYGNAIDAQNAEADKAYIKSDKFDNFYEKEFKNIYTKEQFTKAVIGYRKAGITSEKDIKKSLKLEQHYLKKENNPNNLSEEKIRAQVQNIVANYNDLGSEHKKAFVGDKKAEEALKKDTAILLGGDTKENRKKADIIYKGYEDYRRM